MINKLSILGNIYLKQVTAEPGTTHYILGTLSAATTAHVYPSAFHFEQIF